MAVILLHGALPFLNIRMEVLKCFYHRPVSQWIYRAHYFHLQSHKIRIYPAEPHEIPSCKHLVSGAVPAQHDQLAVLRPPTSVLQTSDSKTLK